jgi:hypothetical protein
MKGVFWSLLATLAGTAMLVAGIAGVAGAFDGDDDSDSSSSSADVSDFTDCGEGDPRFAEFNMIELTGDAGRATVIVSCQDGTVELSMIGTDFRTDKDRNVTMWLYNSRDDAELVDSTPQETSDDTVVVSGSLPDDSADYKKIVVTEEKFDLVEDPDRPSTVILQGRP